MKMNHHMKNVLKLKHNVKNMLRLAENWDGRFGEEWSGVEVERLLILTVNLSEYLTCWLIFKATETRIKAGISNTQ